MRGAGLLKAWLAESGRSLSEIGRACGVGKVAVWLWVHGRSRPTPERRRVLSRLSCGAVCVDSWDEADELRERFEIVGEEPRTMQLRPGRPELPIVEDE